MVFISITGREMSCTPDLGKMMAAPLRSFLSFLLKICDRVYVLWVLGHHFAQPRGPSKAQSRRRRDVSSIELIAGAARRVSYSMAHLAAR